MKSHRFCFSLAFISFVAVALEVANAEPILDLSDAQGYNLLTWGNATLLNSDTEGKVAVGGNASFNSYSIGGSAVLPNSQAAALVVGGSLAAGNGQVFNGSIYVGGAYSGPGYNLNSAPGSVTQAGLGAAGLPFDFAAAKSALQAKSLDYGAAAANGTSVLQWSTFTLTGTDADLNIFDIDAATLLATSTLVFDVVPGSRVLINITGQAVQLANMGFAGDYDAENTLFNLSEATSLSLSGIGIEGSILAPFADVSFVSGQMNGQLIANSFQGAAWGVGELHNHSFNNDTSPPPSVPDGANSGLLVLTGLVGAALLRRFPRSMRG